LSFQNSSTQWVKNAIADNTTFNGQNNKHLSPVILKPIADKSLNSGHRIKIEIWNENDLFN